jgi:iron complex outermembrane receptor protein
MAGVVYSPVATVSLYGSFGRAFAPPSIQVVGPRDPEESRQVEVGVKKTFLDGKVFATVSGYDLKRENIAIPDASGISRQAGDQRSRGVEFELSAEVSKGWFTYGAYAFTDAELTQFRELVTISQNPPAFVVLDRSGNRPAFAPRHILNVWTQKQFANGLGLGGGARYVGGQFIAEDNAFALDDYLTLDAMVSYKRGPAKAVVNFKNLTDREYETRGFGAASAIPADPFAVYARIELSFGKR